MTKQVRIIIAVIILLLVLGGVMAFVQTRKPAPAGEQMMANQNTVSPIPAVSPESPTRGTLQSLMHGGKNVSCQISMPELNSQGTTYVAGSKMRSDYNIKIAEKEMATHTISDGTFMYMWSDGVAQGTKFKIDADAPKPSIKPGQAQAPDLNKEMDLKCAPWTVDDSKFDLPANVSFADMSEMMKNVQKQISSGSAAMPKMDKSVCDQIADATAKAACLKALGN